MSTEIAMILAAAIGVGASLLTLLLTRIFDVRSEKRKEQERFFYEIYGRRFALYRKILKQIYLFSDITSSDPLDSPMKFGNITETFIALSNRGALVASPVVANSLKLISNFISDWVFKGKGVVRAREDVEAFVSFMTKHMTPLQDRIREETCPVLVDKFLFKLTGTRFNHKTSFPVRDGTDRS